MKKNTKHKLSENRRYMKQTGGGGPPPCLNNNDEEIMNIISGTSTFGNKVSETNINFVFDEVSTIETEINLAIHLSFIILQDNNDKLTKGIENCQLVSYSMNINCIFNSTVLCEVFFYFYSRKMKII